MALPTIYFIIGLAYILLFVGLGIRDIAISILASFTLFGLSTYILINGIDIFKNSTTDIFAVVTLGVAAYVSWKASGELIE